MDLKLIIGYLGFMCALVGGAMLVCIVGSFIVAWLITFGMYPRYRKRVIKSFKRRFVKWLKKMLRIKSAKVSKKSMG